MAEMREQYNTTDTDDSSNEFFDISDNVLMIYTYVVFSVVCQMISIFGIITNIINIIGYVKQGLKDSVNISLLGLSVSDLCSLVTMCWICISLNPALNAADLPFEPLEVTYLAVIVPHLSFNRVSSCITAMITLERCLCIIAPLKIKRIFSAFGTFVATICIFIISFCSATPVYVVSRLDKKFYPLRNKTITGLVFTADRENVDTISFAINNFAIPLCAFAIVLICTILIFLKLQIAARWRLQTITYAQVDRVSSRNQRVAKMVIMMSTLFIACFVPMSVCCLALGLVPDLALQGKYVKVAIIIAGISYTMECINSSVNIFIYYHMSSKYREVLCRMCYRSTTLKYEGK